MNLVESFDPDLIDIDIKAETKHDAVEALVDLFCAKFPDADKRELMRAVGEREELGSTSFGRGFAFPHARTDIVSDLHIALGVVHKGVADRGPDNVSIKIICLLLTPRNISKLYLQTLSGLANLARRQGILERLSSADTPRELLDIIRESGITVKRTITVTDIMSDKVITVTPDDSLKTVANIMFKYNFDGVPVIDGEGRLVGDVSGRELIRSALPGPDSADDTKTAPFDEFLRQEDNLCVKDVMRIDVPTIAETASAVEAAAMMLSRKFNRVMVVRDSKLIGIVSVSDIISKIIRG